MTVGGAFAPALRVRQCAARLFNAGLVEKLFRESTANRGVVVLTDLDLLHQLFDRRHVVEPRNPNDILKTVDPRGGFDRNTRTLGDNLRYLMSSSQGVRNRARYSGSCEKHDYQVPLSPLCSVPGATPNQASNIDG